MKKDASKTKSALIEELDELRKRVRRLEREAERVHQRSEDRYRGIFDNSALGIFQSTPEGQFLKVNAAGARMLGYESPEAMLAEVKSIADSIYVEPENRHRIVEATMGQPGMRRFESEYRRKDGGIFIGSLHICAVRDESGAVQYLEGFLEDISEHKRAEEERNKIEAQMRMTQKLESLGVLAGGIAHDFNNLLMGVLGNASLALMELPEASPVRECVEQIEDAAKRAADLAKQMLAYSGKGKFVVKSVDLSVLVEEMSKLLQASTSKNVELDYEFAPNLSAIEGDVTQLRQVIMNLVINASEAIGEDTGVVTVRTGMMWCEQSYLSDSFFNEDRPAGNYVYLEVADTGCGMDETTRTKIFDPFFTSKFSGRGLGLAVVLGIVRGHKGAVRVYSEPSHGTTFKALFPCSSHAADTLSETQAETATFRGEGVILLVDDEETVRCTAKRMLEKLGFSVLTASDGREGVAVFKAHADAIRAVLLDMTMPQMNGQEVLRKIRRIRKDVPVILSSGYNEQDATARFSGKGLAGFIQKPYQIGTLTEKLSRVLG